MDSRKPPSEAIALVYALMERNPERYGSQAKLAKATKLDQTSWSHYLRGVSVPSRLSRKQIQRTLKIPSESWLIPAKDPRNDPNDSSRDRKALAGEISPAEPVLDRSGEYAQDRPSTVGAGV